MVQLAFPTATLTPTRRVRWRWPCSMRQQRVVLWEREPFGLLGRPATRRRSRQSVLLLEDRASLAILLETQFAFGEAPLEYVDPGFPTAARPGWASTAAAYQEHDADDEEEPEQWPGQDPQPASKSH
jgi:hypothetical protein